MSISLARQRTVLVSALLGLTAILSVIAWPLALDRPGLPGGFFWTVISPGTTFHAMLFGLHSLPGPPWLSEALVVAASSIAWTVLMLAAIWAAGFLKKCVRRPHAATARRGLLLALALYGALWALTATVGRSELRSLALTAERDTLKSYRPSSEPHQWDTHAERGALAPPMPFYFADAAVPGPLVIRIERGFVVEGLFAGGGRDWYLWLPGIHLHVVQTRLWVS